MNGDTPEVQQLDARDKVGDLYRDDTPSIGIFRPMRDMVLAQYIEEDSERKVGSLFIPHSKKSRDKLFVRAVVTSCGNKCEHVKVGSTILVGEHHGDYYNVDGKRSVLIRERDISGIVT